MFQTYAPVSDRNYASKYLPALRNAMAEQNLDGFLIPHDDEYQNEYIPEYAERLMWVSGFSGSAGFAIVLNNRAAIFVDGRYTLQVQNQTDDQFFSYEDYTLQNCATWLGTQVKAGQRIGYDPMLHTESGLTPFLEQAKIIGFELIAIKENPVDAAWIDQPKAPTAAIYPHELAHAGKSSEDKRRDIAIALQALNVDAALITTPPSIAWVFNIRGSDVDRSPLPLSRAILYKDGKADLFFDQTKNTNSLSMHLGNDVSTHDETAVMGVLRDLGQNKTKILIDQNQTPIAYNAALKSAGAQIIYGDDPCALPRATKNETEIQGSRNAHIRDGVAVTKFLHWLATTGQSGEVDEIEAASTLEKFRAEDENLRDLSFDSISGAGSNGAIVHYRVTTETTKKLALNSLFLIDSGGQYPDGTTDITRTVPIGKPTSEMCDRFTRVLKGHIALACARFPKGTTGHQLDILARLPLYQVGLDYDHGTGHGVGSFLGVHEGPQRIAKWPNAIALRPGMILSNEPGYYKTGEFGIRIENLIVVSKPAPVKNGEREMMSFETVTLAPINLDLIDTALLDEQEKTWLNEYHARVRETLSPLLPQDIADWLQEVTKAV